VYSLIGRNGAGKTTLVKTLMGLVKTRAGSIRFQDHEVRTEGAAARARRGIGYVPQGRGIFGHLTVSENLEIGASIGGSQTAQEINKAREEIHELFPRLQARAKQKAGTLSGGEQQQLAIGRVLVGNPSLILLDEPSDGVQPNIIQEIGEIIKQVRSDHGLTIVLVEQNLDLISSVADRCGVVDKGTVEVHIDPQEVEDPEVARKYLAI
jgi:branched-chain amino acid transport system ATP-binding protein